MRLKLSKDRRPRIACEFTATHVVAAHLADNGIIDNYSVRSVESGTVVPDLSATNLANRDTVCTALKEALAALNSRGRDLSVILPDASFRLALVDLDVLPEKPQEADTLVRHRLKKSLPFDVDKARVCWQMQQVNGKVNLLVAAALRSVLDEYESAVREAGCSPGLVLPAILALLRLVDATVSTLLIKVDPATVSIVIVHQGAVVLIRVLDRISGQQFEVGKIADAICPSLMFFQDTYGTNVQKILITGVVLSEAQAAALEELTGIRAQQLAGAEPLTAVATNPSSLLRAVSGSLVPGL